jgi:hypothetical protein
MITRAVNLTLFLIATVFTISCSNLIEKVDDTVLNGNSTPFIKEVKKTYCSPTDKTQLFSHNKLNHSALKSFIAKYNLSFVESIVILTFIQMNERPDIASPMASMTAIIDNKYIQFHNNKSNNLFFSLHYLLKKHKAPRSLSYLAFLFDSYFPNNFIVTKDFSDYLYSNRKNIQENQALNKHYTRAEETLRENEKIPREKLRPKIRKSLKTYSSYKTEDKLQGFEKIQCNYEFTQYQNKNFNILPTQDNSLTYGIMFKGHAALIVLTHNIDFSAKDTESIFFPGSKLINTPSACLRTDKKNNKDIWVISTHSRDSAQHLTNLYRNNTFRALSKNDIDQNVRAPRLLFLNDPERAVFESERASNSHKDKLLKLRVPIYNSPSLGGITSFYRNKNEEGFILDDRLKSMITCR